MIRVLINDGIESIGKEILEKAGIEADVRYIDQNDLPKYLNDYDAICVRSATKVRKELIDACPNLKVIGRGGVGLDNIDVDYAKSKGIKVINTPAASSRSVAELAMAHILGLSRFLYVSNREMPTKGNTHFKDLKKSFAAGSEIEGKTLGIIGFGRIGRQLAGLAAGASMNVIAHDPYIQRADIHFGPKHLNLSFNMDTVSMEEVLSKADYLSLHIPSVGRPVIGADEFSKMKEGAFIINCSRGGTVDEEALIEALNSGRVAGAGLDVFVGEPTPKAELLNHPRVSLTPHIGASTEEAQNKIAIELASSLIEALMPEAHIVVG